jgi:hypothetical protein
MDTWTFSTEFEVPEDVAKRSSIDLVLDGVDTFATVYLNDKQVAALENFHRWAGRGPRALAPDALPSAVFAALLFAVHPTPIRAVLAPSQRAPPRPPPPRLAIPPPLQTSTPYQNTTRKYLIPVKSQLKPGTNTLKIVLAPAIKVAIERKANHPYWIPTVTVS